MIRRIVTSIVSVFPANVWSKKEDRMLFELIRTLGYKPMTITCAFK